ncbi:MAG: gamma-glutamylcyclotransferase [Caulobacteraceae bacterium]|nr:gamma-glutamylcyclotransferase [Caulobacter sp.]
MTAAEGLGAPERWVFGFGSLMWRPGFPYLERRPAVLHGRRRAFCIYSVHHRGTAERPGLVLGLLPGGRTKGAAYRLAEAEWPAAYAYLLDREQPTETYREARRAVTLLAKGENAARRVEALLFLSDQTHPQWAGDLPEARQAELIAGAEGLSGRNVDYLRDLCRHLREVGATDTRMERLLQRVEALEASPRRRDAAEPILREPRG